MPFIKSFFVGFLGLIVGVTALAGSRPVQDNWMDPDLDETSSYTDSRSIKKKGSNPQAVEVSSSKGLEEVAPFSPHSNNLGLDLGQIFLIGDLKKYSDGLGLRIHYVYGVSDLLAFDANLTYSQHSNGDLTLYGLLTGIRINFSVYDSIIPYGVFGLGFYLPNYVDRTSPPSGQSPNQLSSSKDTISSVLFGLYFGPGVNLVLNKRLFFGTSLLFNNMFSAESRLKDGSQLKLGGAYLAFLVNMGVTF